MANKMKTSKINIQIVAGWLFFVKMWEIPIICVLCLVWCNENYFSMIYIIHHLRHVTSNCWVDDFSNFLFYLKRNKCKANKDNRIVNPIYFTIMLYRISCHCFLYILLRFLSMLSFK